MNHVKKECDKGRQAIVTIAPDRKIWTDEEFMALPEEGRYELVNGELVNMGNSGMEHGEIGSFLGGSLSLYVRSTKLGRVCDSSTAFTMKNGNRRSHRATALA